MNNKYIYSAIAAIVIVIGSYIFRFYFQLHHTVSDNVEQWAQLGDYAGGLLNPILSFISLVLLIKSLNLQNEANLDLRKELKTNEKNEKLRSFEAYFFNMLNSQKIAYDSFKLEFENETGIDVLVGVEAVMKIEDDIDIILEDNNLDDVKDKISKYIETLDEKDKIFSMVRIFYIIIKMIDDKLSDNHGFTAEDRNKHYTTLINFTEFSLLRLIMISCQFLSCHPSAYINSHSDFNAILEDVGLSTSLY